MSKVTVQKLLSFGYGSSDPRDFDERKMEKFGERANLSIRWIRAND